MTARALRWWRPRCYAVAGVLLVLLALAAVLTTPGRAGAAAANPPPAAAGPTAVSITFDDGDADQMTAAKILADYGMHGTFYLVPGAVGTPHYVSRDDLRRLAAGGNEIGAHTVSHVDLERVSLGEARRQLCDSRDILRQWGYRVTSFAYPNGGYTPPVEAAARACGYDSARTIEGLRSPGCPTCEPVESIPAVDPYAVRAAGEIEDSWTAAYLESLVLDASATGGGWLPLIVHHVCDSGCGNFSIRPAVLAEFLSWLNLRQQFNLNRVLTVAQATGGPDRPAVTVPAAPAHGVVQPSLEQTAPSAISSDQETIVASGFPACWMPGGYGDNTPTWQRTKDAHTGAWAERLTMSKYVNGDAKLVQRFDLGECVIPVKSGEDHVLHTWYRSSTRLQYSVYYRTPSGRWTFWKSSPFFAPKAHWSEATWRAPPLPPDATGLSFGLAIASDGWLVTDDSSIRTVPPYRDPTPLVGAGLLLGSTLLTMRSRIRRRATGRVP